MREDECLSLVCVGGVGGGGEGRDNLYNPQRSLSPTLLSAYRLVGLVVKASSSRAGDPGFESRLCREFPGVESYQ